ncbi:sulfotransferase 6B1-like [Pelodytes ibericus]
MSSSESGTKTDREKFLEEMKRVSAEASKKTPEELVLEYKGILYPSSICSKETFQALESFEAREDDFLIATYPKCGTNWAMQILQEVLFSIHKREITVDQAMLELGKPEKVEILKGKSSPRLFASHLYYDELPKSYFEKKAKILIILRNPKDTAVSYYHFSNSNAILPSFDSWDLFFKAYMEGKVCWGSYFDYSLAWNKHIDDKNIMAVTFEDMKEDFQLQLQNISDFFGLNLTKEQITLVENKTTFKSMQEKSKNTHGAMSNAFFRKGEIGDWKNYFTEEQSKEVDAKFEASLAGTKLGEKINYNKYCKF